MRMFFLGTLNPVLSCALRYASYRVSPKHATSPVLDISTPSKTSAPCRRENEKTGTWEDKQHKIPDVIYVHQAYFDDLLSGLSFNSFAANFLTNLFSQCHIYFNCNEHHAM